MDFYNETNFIGELWSRDADNNIFSVNQSLSSIFRKYKDSNITFYNELTSNSINKFDLFYDSFFIQTKTGYIFEKYVTNNNNIEPFDKINNFSSNQTEYNVDYWFDETNKIVYLFEFLPTNYINPRGDLNAIQFSFIFKSFDTKTNIIKNLLKENVIFWIENSENLISNGILEHPKLTYNHDTNTFNSSFIVKNDTGKTGIISMNFKEKEIKKIDTFIPYGTVKPYLEPSATPQPTYIPATPTITPTSTINNPTPTLTPTCTLNNVCNAKVGDVLGGGIVAYITQSSDDGYDPNYIQMIIVTPSNQEVTLNWDDANTYCFDLVYNGYNDWFLPSSDELEKICANKTLIGGLFTGEHWCSEEIDLLNGKYVDWNDCSTGSEEKTFLKLVRPARIVSYFCPSISTPTPTPTITPTSTINNPTPTLTPTPTPTLTIPTNVSVKSVYIAFN